MSGLAVALPEYDQMTTCEAGCLALRDFGYEWYYLYVKYADIVKQASTLICLTGAVASKIFACIQEGTSAFFNFGYHSLGVSYLNSGIRSLFASVRDLSNAIEHEDIQGVVLTSLKIIVKSVNILLATAAISGLVAGAIGFPGVFIAMVPYIAIVAEISWLMSIFNEFSDYYQNSRIESDLTYIREKVKLMGSGDSQDHRIQLTVRAFLMLSEPDRELPPLPDGMEKKFQKKIDLSLRLVRQLDEVTLMSIQRALKEVPSENSISGLSANLTERCFQVFEREIVLKQESFVRNAAYALITTPLLEASKYAFGGALELPLRWVMSLIATVVAVDTIFSHDKVTDYLEGKIEIM